MSSRKNIPSKQNYDILQCSRVKLCDVHLKLQDSEDVTVGRVDQPVISLFRLGTFLKKNTDFSDKFLVISAS
jgi:hypothetical protein